MLDILASGRVIKLVPARSASGTQYVRVSMIVGQGEKSALINASAFDGEIIAALDKVKVGDSISVSGNGSISAYSKEGEPRASLNVFINRLLTHKAAKEQQRNPNNFTPRDQNPRNYGQPWGLD